MYAKGPVRRGPAPFYPVAVPGAKRLRSGRYANGPARGSRTPELSAVSVSRLRIRLNDNAFCIILDTRVSSHSIRYHAFGGRGAARDAPGRREG